MSDDGAQPINCASYTHARRHPMVLGSIGGWSPPFQLTMTQLAVLLASALAVNKTWHLWGPLFPPVMSVLVALAGPALAAWAARRVRIEGRSPARAAVGWVALLAAPRDGSIDGRPAREPRASELGASRTWVAAIHAGGVEAGMSRDHVDCSACEGIGCPICDGTGYRAEYLAKGRRSATTAGEGR